MEGLKLYFLDEDSAGTTARDKDDFRHDFSFLLYRPPFRGVIKIVPYNYRMNGVFNPFAVKEEKISDNLGYNATSYMLF